MPREVEVVAAIVVVEQADPEEREQTLAVRHTETMVDRGTILMEAAVEVVAQEAQGEMAVRVPLEVEELPVFQRYSVAPMPEVVLVVVGVMGQQIQEMVDKVEQP